MRDWSSGVCSSDLRATQINRVITKIGKQRFCLLFDPGHVVTASLKHDAAMTKHVAHSMTIVAVIYLVRYACLNRHFRRTDQLLCRCELKGANTPPRQRQQQIG